MTNLDVEVFCVLLFSRERDCSDRRALQTKPTTIGAPPICGCCIMPRCMSWTGIICRAPAICWPPCDPVHNAVVAVTSWSSRRAVFNVSLSWCPCAFFVSSSPSGHCRVVVVSSCGFRGCCRFPCPRDVFVLFSSSRGSVVVCSPSWMTRGYRAHYRPAEKAFAQRHSHLLI